MAEEGLKVTDHNKIFIGKPQEFNRDEIFSQLAELKSASEEEDVPKVISMIKKLVDSYRKPEDVNKLR